MGVRTSINVVRVPIKLGIVRKSITCISDAGYSYGKWMHFPVVGEKPHYQKRESDQILWCPYCGAWTIYRACADDRGTWKCTGWCGWGNTNEYYVKKMNDLFGYMKRRKTIPKIKK